MLFILENFYLNICYSIVRVGDGALIAIAEGCSLRSLNVSGCHQIGDAGVISIARGCPQLSHVDVSVLQVCFRLCFSFCITKTHVFKFP